MLKSSITWDKEMAFDVNIGGYNFMIDADAKVGGKDRGPSPKPLLLVALGGCTAMDVISILKKMQVKVDSFDVDVAARSTDVHPKYYDKFVISYIFEGENLPIKKIKRAVELSETRYCGVSFMFKKTSEIESKIIINGEEIK
ncbi:MAG: OsmC family protein [Candidatus Cloacimonadota bacterium]|nr:OsmC family protein [Candidatus Cloacimonadota bacterium]